MDKQVCIGTIVAPHGVRGDIRILPQTEHPEQFLVLDYLLLEDGRTLHLTNARFHKRMALIKCREVNNMNEAEMLRGQKVYINTEDLPELEEGEFYVADLLGCNVADESGKAVGVRQAMDGGLSSGSAAAVSGEYVVGQRVEHPKFGVGIVQRIETLSTDHKLVVAFDNAGEKTLLAKFAKLTKL